MFYEVLVDGRVDVYWFFLVVCIVFLLLIVLFDIEVGDFIEDCYVCFKMVKFFRFEY